MNTERNIGLGAAQADAAEATLDHRDPWRTRKHKLRGLAGELYAYILRVCGCYQPKFAEAATLTLIGALLGRGVKSDTGARTNIYTLPVGYTSAGKNDPIRIIQKVVHALGRAQRLLAGEMTSQAALEKTLEAFPVRLLLLDEIGHYFGTLKNTRGGNNGYLATVIPALTKLWSAADRDHQLGTRATPQEDTKKWRPPSVLHQPCLCVYGTTAPQPLYANLTEADLSDGSLPRYVAFISLTREEYKPANEEPPDDLMYRIDQRLIALGLIPTMYSGGEDKTPLPLEPRLIQHTPEAHEIMSQFETFKTDKLREADNGEPILYLWGKARENAERIALAVACFGDNPEPEIDAESASYAVELMKLSITDMVAATRENLGKDKTAKDRAKILDAIRRAGEKGITGSALCKLTQTIKPRDRRDYLEELEENGQIVSTPIPSGGPKPTWLYHYADTEDVIQ